MDNQKLQKLIFVYNANSGIGNMILDGVHKIVSPGTYKCNLCDITYGAFAENKVWKKFREGTTLEMEFLHKNEFQKQYASKFGHKVTFPIVLTATNNVLEVFIATEELNALNSTVELIDLIKNSNKK